jgi:hypothetical protein
LSYKPYKLGKSLGYAFLIWIIGFIWGITVFMIPLLNNIASIPYISKFPAISAPLIIVYIILLYFLTRNYLQDTEFKANEGLMFGITIFVVNLVLDFVAYIILFKSTDYYAYLSIWISYALAILIPWLIGRHLQVTD